MPDEDEVPLLTDLTERVSSSEAARDGAEEAQREVDAKGAEVEKTEASEAAGLVGAGATEATGREEQAEVLAAMLREERTGELAETADFDAEVCLVRGLACCSVRRVVVRAELAAVACM